MAAHTSGIRTFLQRHCSDPAALISVFEGEHRLYTLSANERLCSAGEEAESVWIVEEGQQHLGDEFATGDTERVNPE